MTVAGFGRINSTFGFLLYPPPLGRPPAIVAVLNNYLFSDGDIDSGSILTIFR